MSTVADNFLSYALNARATSGTQGYTGSNRADATAVNGWSAVEVLRFDASSSNFAAQAYTDGNGNFRVSIRPSQTVGDWTNTNTALTAGKWNAELTDAIRFYGELILQVQQNDRSLRLDDIRAKIDGSGFSQGGALIEMASKFWGTRGMNIDGPGVNSQVNLADFSSLKTEFRERGLSDLQDNYTLVAGQFQARAYTSIGQAGTHITDAVYVEGSSLETLQSSRDVAAWLNSSPDAATAGVWVNIEQTMQWHNLNRIMAAEGYSNPDASAAALRLNTNPIITPTDSASRVSSNYITDASSNDHLVEIKSGGTVWDAYVTQKTSANGFSSWNDFKSAVAASNPGLSDLNNIASGTKLYLPEKLSDGSITYNFANGTSINSNAITGEYHMVVQNADGGQTVYSRSVDGDAGYSVHQVTTDGAGSVTSEYNAHQESLDSDIKSIDLDTHSTIANAEAWTYQRFDAAGNATELQTAVYDSKKGLTDINSYKDGDLVAHVAVQGKVTQAQLDQALALAEQMGEATSFVDTGKSEGGQTLLETLGVPDGGGLGETDVSTGAGSALQVSDSQYSGSNENAAPMFTALNDYASWLTGRGTVVDVNTNNLVADPSLLALQDGPLPKRKQIGGTGMKTISACKKRLLRFLLLIVVWPALAFAQTTTDKIEELRGQGYSITSITPVFSQLIAFSLPVGFVTVSENAQDGLYMREAIPKGETVNTWTQMLTLSGFKDLARNSNLDLVTFSIMYMKQMVKKCSSNSSGRKVANLKVGEYDALIYFVSCASVNYSGAVHSEQTLFLSIKGDSDYYMILLAERGPPQESIPVFERDKWVNRFNQIKPIKLCPRVQGEAPPYSSCAKG